jgi:hypothetical protein
MSDESKLRRAKQRESSKRLNKLCKEHRAAVESLRNNLQGMAKIRRDSRDMIHNKIIEYIGELPRWRRPFAFAKYYARHRIPCICKRAIKANWAEFRQLRRRSK